MYALIRPFITNRAGVEVATEPAHFELQVSTCTEYAVDFL